MELNKYFAPFFKYVGKLSADIMIQQVPLYIKRTFFDTFNIFDSKRA